MNKAGGWLYEKEDRSFLEIGIPDLNFRNCCTTKMNVPEELDPRSWSPVRNQSSEGSCQGHSITAAGEGCYWVASRGSFMQYSPDVAYYLTQQKDGIRGDQGSTISGGIWVATNIGFCPEAMMPYSPKYNPNDLPLNVKELCAPFKVASHKSLRSYEDVYNWISRGLGFVSYGITWNVSVSPDGFMQWKNGGGGGHANAIMGYSKEKSDDGLPKFLWGKNSWGDWGPLQGWYKISRQTFEQFVRHQFTVVMGISDMIDIQPRKIDFIQQSVIQ